MLRVAAVTELPEGLVEEVQGRLAALGDGDTAVKDASLEVVDDLEGALSARVTLRLPVPSAGTWDPETLLLLRREARSVVDRVFLNNNVSFEGMTSVHVTTVEAMEADIAVTEEPEPGETEGTEA